MNAVYVYMIKVSLAMLLFYLFYRLLIRKETFHAFSRLYLLSSLLLSLLLPLLQSPAAAGTLVPGGGVLQEIVIGAVVLPLEEGKVFDYERLAVALYLLGAAWVALLFCYNLLRILYLRYHSEKASVFGYTCYIPAAQVSAFTFGRWIFIDRETLDADHGFIVFKHEFVHASEHHSFDIILVELLKVVFWFHPAIWLYKKSMLEVHEYLADDRLLKRGQDPAGYMQVLLQQSISYPTNIIFSHFNHSLIKRRFIMITKPKSGKFSATRIALVMPFMLAASFLLVNLFSNPVFSQDAKSKPVKKETKKEVIKNEPAAQEEVFSRVEKMPEYPGGIGAVAEFISKNIVYPAIAKQNGITANIYVQFVIDANGKLTEAKILKSKADYADAKAKKPGEEVSKKALQEMEGEALRVVNALPGKWTPGMDANKAVRVSMTLPVKFKLN